MASVFSVSMNEYPINLEWTIAEERLKALKDSTKNEFLQSEKFTAIHSSGVQYSLRIYPNGYKENTRGKTWVLLDLELGNEKTVEAEFTYSIKFAGWSYKFNYVFEARGGWCKSCCTTDKLFDPSKKFFVDGKLTLIVEGILFIEKADWKTQNVGDLWNMDFKDFTITADGKELKVHKCVLAAQSPVFEAMFKPHTKEAMEGKVLIPDFEFEIVEKAVKLCYSKNLVPDISIDDAITLLKFADKYLIEMLKANLENYLGDQLTVSNVCEIMNCTTAANFTKLQNKCLDYLIQCLSEEEFVPKIETLDRNVVVTILKDGSFHECETL